MTQLVMLTGFLGTGKTTLMMRLLNQCGNATVGVIVNEFGEINIDARLLEKDGVTMRELSNGSIFCSCIKETFLKSLIDMSSYAFDYLFIEASGLADPSNIGEILEAMREHTVYPFHYSGCICVLDGESFLEMNTLLPAIRNQLTNAGVVLANKADLIDSKTQTAIQAEVRKVNLHAPIYFTSYCDIDIGTVLKNLRPAKSESKESTNTPESRPQTFIIKILPSVTMKELHDFLNYVAPYTYRLKGFVCVSDNNYSVSGVRSHVMIVPWVRKVESSEVVLISSLGIKLTSIVAEAINLYAPQSIKLN